MSERQLSCPYCGETWSDGDETDWEDESVAGEQGMVQRVCGDCLAVHLLS